MTGRVYIVDDEAMMRRLLKRSLSHAGMHTEVFEDGLEFLSVLDKLEPGVVILDIRMPKIDGLQVLESMGSRIHIHPVLILSSHGDVPVAVRAMQAGALDFLEKPFSLSLLIDRVREAHNKIEKWKNDQDFKAASRSLIATLTDREREVAGGIVKGLSNKQMARAMSISPRTVEAHRAKLMKKLNISSVVEIVRLFVN